MDKSSGKILHHYNLGNQLSINKVETLYFDEIKELEFIGTYDLVVARQYNQSSEFSYDYVGHFPDIIGNAAYLLDFEYHGQTSWLHTTKGLAKFNDHDTVFYSFNSQFSNTSPLLNTMVYEDSANVWLSGKGLGSSNVYHFNGESYSTVFNSELSGDCGIYKDLNEKIWACYQGGIACYDGVEWHFWNESNSIIFDDEQVRSMAQDAGGKYYFGSNKGILCFQNNEWLRLDTSNSNLISNNITKLLIDDDNNLWAGTFSKGLMKFNGSHWVHFPTASSPIESNKVKPIFKDTLRNEMWLLAEQPLDGGGAVCIFYKYKNKLIEKVTEISRLGPYRKIISDDRGNINILFEHGVLKFADNKKEVFDFKMDFNFDSKTWNVISCKGNTFVFSDNFPPIKINENGAVLDTTLQNKDIGYQVVDDKGIVWSLDSYESNGNENGFTRLTSFDGINKVIYGPEDFGITYFEELDATDNKLSMLVNVDGETKYAELDSIGNFVVYEPSYLNANNLSSENKYAFFRSGFNITIFDGNAFTTYADTNTIIPPPLLPIDSTYSQLADSIYYQLIDSIYCELKDSALSEGNVQISPIQLVYADAFASAFQQDGKGNIWGSQFIDTSCVKLVNFKGDHFQVLNLPGLPIHEYIKSGGNTHLTPNDYGGGLIADENGIWLGFGYEEGLFHYNLEKGDYDELESNKTGSDPDHFKLFPNPTKGILNIEYELFDKEFADIRLFDSMGLPVEGFSVENTTTGNSQWRIDLSHLQTGCYFIQLNMNDKKLSQPFILFR